MTHSRRTSFDCQLVDAYLVRLQSDIEAKWREIRCIRDEIGLLMRSRARVRSTRWRDSSDRHRAPGPHVGDEPIVRETLLELREAAQTLARDLDDESGKP